MPKIISNGKVVEFPSAGQATVDIDPTLTKSEDGTLGVSSPVQSILTQEEFNALPVEKQDKGLYVIKDENNNDTARSLTVNGQTVSFPSSVNVSSNLKPVKITLLADDWDENGEQTVDVPDILADESLQLITPTPSSSSFNDYYTADIMLVAQGEGALTFRALNDTLSIDCEVLVYIQSVTENAEPEFPTEYIWWSPEMTSDTTPSPYQVTSLTNYVSRPNPYVAFDGDRSTDWQSDNVSDTWIQFDFGTYDEVISGIQFYAIERATSGFDSRQIMPKVFDILGSNDGENWVLLFHSNGEKYPNPVSIPYATPHEYIFDPVKCRYIRFRQTNNYLVSDSSRCHYIMLSEIKFYKGVWEG